MRPVAFAALLLLAFHALDAMNAGLLDAQTRRVPVDPARARAMRASFDSAVVDTHVSAEAQKVLQTIPDPVSANDRVPAPAVAVVRVDSSAAVADSTADAVADSSATLEEAETDSSSVPLPEPREVLGDFTLPVATVDSLLAPASTAGAAVPTGGFGGVGAATSSAAAVHPDSCWGVQLAAPPEAERAEAIRAAAQSLLMIPMKIHASGGRDRVQTRDCMNAATAELLRKRAIDSGFVDAFRTGGGAAAKSTPGPGKTGAKSGKR